VARQRVQRRTSGRKYPQKRRKAKIPSGLIFWTAFLIFVTGLFFINRDQIADSLEKTRFLERLAVLMRGGEPVPAGEQPAAEPPVSQSPVNRDAERAPALPASPEPPPARTGTAQSSPRPVEDRGGSPGAPVRQPAESSAEQTLYFIRVEDDGAILRSKITRRIPVSETPLLDTLRALIAGPGAEEERQGMISLIPPDTRILSVVIEGNTARINFSEEFQYNTAGMEGLAAQLTQIVWTATEFPNVKNVQILIEGNRIDHLGEGLPVWGPLDRQSF
jgi:spore germination protein GerM